MSVEKLGKIGDEMWIKTVDKILSTRSKRYPHFVNSLTHKLKIRFKLHKPPVIHSFHRTYCSYHIYKRIFSSRNKGLGIKFGAVVGVDQDSTFRQPQTQVGLSCKSLTHQ